MSFLKGFVGDIIRGIEDNLFDRLRAADDVNPGKTPGDDFKPGDISIENITLLSSDEERRYSLMSQITGIDIYESLLSPVIYAELVVMDTIGLAQKFPILGMEFVSITFSTPERESTTYRFFVNGRPNNVKILDNNKGQSYTLKLVSYDILKNIAASDLKGGTDRVQNKSAEFAFRRVKDNYTGLIKDILQNDLKVKADIKIDDTKGVQEERIAYGSPDYTGSPMTPFRYIDKFRQLANDLYLESGSFVFYQNKKGYRFTTIEKLMDDGAKKISSSSDLRFFFDTARNEDVEDVKFRNILAYNHIQEGDTIDYMRNSGFAGSATVWDSLTFDAKKHTYIDNRDDKFKTSDPDGANQFGSDFARKFGKAAPASRLVTSRADLPDTRLAEKIAKAQAFVAKITQNILQIEIYGDSELKVGDVIECNLPSATTTDDDTGTERLVSGNYLVTKVRHMILNTDRPQHIMSLELIKCGLVER